MEEVARERDYRTASLISPQIDQANVATLVTVGDGGARWISERAEDSV
jgi:hypothetical protein